MRALLPLPERFAATRFALHRLAIYVVSPARRHATGNEIALEATPGGFGTPAGEHWGQVRVQGDLLVVRHGAEPERSAAISTLRAAATFAGVDPGVPHPADIDAPLALDRPSVGALAAFHTLVSDALTELRDDFTEAEDALPVRLWPEHFDVAIDAGAQKAARRGSWGGSPGDAAHPEPYLYVSLWAAAPDDAFFGERAFAGASLGYDDLLAAPDARVAALAFWREALERLRT
jgi:hypothetical protein